MGALDKFFSVATELARGAKQSMPLEQWTKFMQPGRVLERGGVKFPLRADEVKYGPIGRLLSDPPSQLRAQGSISPEDMANLLEQNLPDYGPQFRTLEDAPHLAGDPPGGMYYENQYQLPGEKLGQSEELTLQPGSDFVPSTAHFGGQKGLLSWHRATRRPVSGTEEPLHDVFTADGDIAAQGIKESAVQPELDSLHSTGYPGAYSKPTGAKGPAKDTAYHIEEIQSDWHQRGREEGYAASDPYKDAEEKVNKQWRMVSNERRPENYDVQHFIGYGGEDPTWQTVHSDWPQNTAADFIRQYRADALRDVQKLPPRAPYEKTYAELELKKGIANAVHNGDSYVTWTTGDQQADRWGQALRNSVDEIHWEKSPDGKKYNIMPMKNGRQVALDQEDKFNGLDANQLEDMLGSDIARKVTSGEGAHKSLTGEEHSDLNNMIVRRDQALATLNLMDQERPERVSRFWDVMHGHQARVGDDGSVVPPDELKQHPDVVALNDNYAQREEAVKVARDINTNQRFQDLWKRYNLVGGEGSNISGSSGVISGDNLTVGGSGMRLFYDRKVPEAARKLAAQYGGEVTKVKLPSNVTGKLSEDDLQRLRNLRSMEPSWFQPEEDPYEVFNSNLDQLMHSMGVEPEDYDHPLLNKFHDIHNEFNNMIETHDAFNEGKVSYQDAVNARNNYKDAANDLRTALKSSTKTVEQEVHALRITPEMRRRVLEAGLPLFSAGALAGMGTGLYGETGESVQGYASGGEVVNKLGKIIAAAVRHLDDGRIFSGGWHGDALESAIPHYYNKNTLARHRKLWGESGADEFLNDFSQEFEQGFVDERGNFLGRDEAMKRARDIGQPLGDTADESIGLHAGDLEVEGHADGGEVIKKLGRIVGAALKDLRTGEVFGPARLHSLLVDDLERSGRHLDLNHMDDGFLTDKGNYLTRQETRDAFRFDPDELDSANVIGMDVPDKPPEGHAEGGPVGFFPHQPDQTDLDVAHVLARRRAVREFSDQVYDQMYPSERRRQEFQQSLDRRDADAMTHWTSSGQASPELTAPESPIDPYSGEYKASSFSPMGIGPHDTDVTDWLRENLPTHPAHGINEALAAVATLFGSTYADTANDPNASYLDKQTALANDMLMGMTATGGLTRALQKPLYEMTSEASRRAPGALAKMAPFAAAAGALSGDRPKKTTIEDLVAGYASGGVIKKLIAAAIKDKAGRVIIAPGETHFEAILKALEPLNIKGKKKYEKAFEDLAEEAVYGFADAEGNFVPREEAAQHLQTTDPETFAAATNPQDIHSYDFPEVRRHIGYDPGADISGKPQRGWAEDAPSEDIIPLPVPPNTVEPRPKWTGPIRHDDDIMRDIRALNDELRKTNWVSTPEQDAREQLLNAESSAERSLTPFQRRKLPKTKTPEGYALGGVVRKLVKGIEDLAGAAWRHKETGQIFGPHTMHIDAFDKHAIQEEGVSADDFFKWHGQGQLEDGFVTHDGNFISRKDATRALQSPVEIHGVDIEGYQNEQRAIEDDPEYDPEGYALGGVVRKLINGIEDLAGAAWHDTGTGIMYGPYRMHADIIDDPDVPEELKQKLMSHGAWGGNAIRGVHAGFMTHDGDFITRPDASIALRMPKTLPLHGLDVEDYQNEQRALEDELDPEGYALGGAVDPLSRIPVYARPFHQGLDILADAAPETALPSRGAGPGTSVAGLPDPRTATPSDAGRGGPSAPVLPPHLLPVPPAHPDDPVSRGNWGNGFVSKPGGFSMDYLSPDARALILNSEGMNQPSAWPGGHSGITIGRGYDLGQHSLTDFQRDWGPYLPADQMATLSKAVGKSGLDAAAVAPSFKNLHVSETTADKVFDDVLAPQYIAQTRAAFPGFDQLPSDAQGALVSLVFNRGPALDGARRAEMANIHAILADGVQAGDLEKIAEQLRLMKRLWAGQGMSGLEKRRDREAELVLSAQKAA